jgi:hypothetical protein
MSTSWHLLVTLKKEGSQYVDFALEPSPISTTIGFMVVSHRSEPTFGTEPEPLPVVPTLNA